MAKRILIITTVIVVLIAIGATAAYITLRQEGEEVKPEQPAVTTSKEPVVQLEDAVTPETSKEPIAQPEEPTTAEAFDTSDWKTYRNEEYGFELKYPSSFTLREMSSNEIWIFFKDSPVSVMVYVNPKFALYHPGWSGYLYEEDARKFMGKFLTHKVEINAIPWEIDYSLHYGGAGSWTKGFNCFTEKGNLYYLIVLEAPTLAIPGPVPEEFWFVPFSPGGLTEEGEIWVIERMVSGEDAFMKAFNKIFRTFRFL